MQIDTVVATDLRRQDLSLKTTQATPTDLKNVAGAVGSLAAAQTEDISEPSTDKDTNSDKKDQKSVTESINKTLEKINNFVPITNTNLVFEFDDISDPPIIKVIDKETKELIREIPSQEIENVAKAFSELADKMNKSGLLLNMEA